MCTCIQCVSITALRFYLGLHLPFCIETKISVRRAESGRTEPNRTDTCNCTVHTRTRSHSSWHTNYVDHLLFLSCEWSSSANTPQRFRRTTYKCVSLVTHAPLKRNLSIQSIFVVGFSRFFYFCFFVFNFISSTSQNVGYCRRI